MFTPEDIQEFRRICEQELDHSCNEAEARAMAQRVILYLLASEVWGSVRRFTERELVVLNLIKEANAKGRSPSIREITKALGLLSSRSGHRFLDGLMKKGIIRRNAEGAIICTGL